MKKVYQDIFIKSSKICYVRYMEPTWGKMGQLSDFDVIQLFINVYAFQRQGRNPSYAHAAVDAITLHRFPPSQKKVWKDFIMLLNQNTLDDNNKKLNEKLNPLYHVYHGKQPCKCIWCIFQKSKMDLKIIGQIKQRLTNEQIKDMWDNLRQIRGVGPKIASLFLRDFSVYFELSRELIKDKDRWLLQPVDTWIRRAVRSFENDTKMKDEEVAKWLVDFDQPELINQGIWYFGSQIARSEYRFCQALKEPSYAKKLFKEHIDVNVSSAPLFKEIQNPKRLQRGL